MNFVITGASGFEALLRKEVERLGGKVEEVQDQAVVFSGDESLLAQTNIWSRVGNRVYLEL